MLIMCKRIGLKGVNSRNIAIFVNARDHGHRCVSKAGAIPGANRNKLDSNETVPALPKF